MSVHDEEVEEVIDAELVDDGGLALVKEPPARPLIDHNTVLHPGQAIPTTATPARSTPSGTCTSAMRPPRPARHGPHRHRPKRAFKQWCAEQGRVAVPCTTATFTEYGRHLMARGL